MKNMAYTDQNNEVMFDKVEESHDDGDLVKVSKEFSTMNSRLKEKEKEGLKVVTENLPSHSNKNTKSVKHSNTHSNNTHTVDRIRSADMSNYEIKKLKFELGEHEHKIRVLEDCICDMHGGRARLQELSSRHPSQKHQRLHPDRLFTETHSNGPSHSKGLAEVKFETIQFNRPKSEEHKHRNSK